MNIRIRAFTRLAMAAATSAVIAIILSACGGNDEAAIEASVSATVEAITASTPEPTVDPSVLLAADISEGEALVVAFLAERELRRQGTAVQPGSLEDLLPRLGLEAGGSFDPDLAYLASSFPAMSSMLAEQASVEDQLAQAAKDLEEAQARANSVSLSDQYDFLKEIADNPKAQEMYSSMNQSRGDYLSSQRNLVVELAQRQDELNAETSYWEVLFKDIVGTEPSSDPYDMEAKILLELQRQDTEFELLKFFSETPGSPVVDLTDITPDRLRLEIEAAVEARAEARAE
ncbi:hypothetical protein N9I50_00840 [bacterium]|nr:hypothetical protein [bacterium]